MGRMRLNEELEVMKGSIVFHRAGNMPMLVVSIFRDLADLTYEKDGVVSRHSIPLAHLETYYQRAIREKQLVGMLFDLKSASSAEVSSVN